MIRSVRHRKNRLLDARDTQRMLRISADTLVHLMCHGQLFNNTFYGVTPWFRIRDVKALRRKRRGR